MTSQTRLLDLYTADLAALALAGKLDPFIGREAQVERLIELMCDSPQKSLMLVGIRGVGKSALIEGVVRRIADGKVPVSLSNKRILRFEPSTFINPYSTPDLELQKSRSFVEELKLSEVTLFIDGIGLFYGFQYESPELEWSAVLSSSLKRGEVVCIVTITPDELAKLQEIQPDLIKCFQPVEIVEPSVEETRDILHGVKALYEAFHDIMITDEAIEAVLQRSVDLMPERVLPGKALDLIDEACAVLRLKVRPNRWRMRQTKTELADIASELEELWATMADEDIQKLKQRESELNMKLVTLQEALKSEPINLVLTAEHIDYVASSK